MMYCPALRCHQRSGSETLRAAIAASPRNRTARKPFLVRTRPIISIVPTESGKCLLFPPWQCHGEGSISWSAHAIRRLTNQPKTTKTADGNTGLVYNGISHHRSQELTGSQIVASVKPAAAIEGQANRSQTEAKRSRENRFDAQSKVRGGVTGKN